MDDQFARAAKTTIVSCDELVPTEYFHSADESRYVYWERNNTSIVVEAPFGAHPSSCNPLYGLDAAHFKQYAASAKEKGGWQAYVDEYIATGEADYLEKVGGADAIRALPLPIY